MKSRSQQTTRSSSRFNPIDIALFVRALPLARGAQRVVSDPVSDVVGRMARRGRGASRCSIERLELAAARAVARWRRWFGGVDTCLTRSLVLGSLLAGRGAVALNIGFRPGEEEPAIDGHAWVSLEGQPVGIDGSLSEERYTRVIEIPFSRRSGAE